MQNFNFHTHTYRCGHADINYTDEDYIKEYIEMGFKNIAFTDHAPQKNENDKRPNIRMKYEDRLEYLDSLNKLKEKYKSKIKIESGYEVEYLPGEEENLKELKAETDKIILGQHFIYDNNKSLKPFNYREQVMFTDEELIRYANYIEKALENNIPDIIAHPDLFMINSKEFGKIEEEITHMICSSAEKYNVPLEINLNQIFYNTYFHDRKLNNDPLEVQKNRLEKVKYPCREFWKIATKYNIKVLYGIDAHNKGQITLFNELVNLAHYMLGEEIISKLNFINNI